jgi:murein DD-endopeptidase MepM/ murein hydrolase activator NlpD
MARQDWINLIRSLSPQYGIDPQAALAVADQEGLSGAVGDNGHAFGPFQLNDAGGVITNRPGNHRAFAESPEGIKWALEQMSKVAKGKRGRQAVAAIVSGFERPHDPTNEIRNATNALARFRPGPTGPSGPAAGPPTRQSAVGDLPAARANSLLGMFNELPAHKEDRALGAFAELQQRAQTPVNAPARGTKGTSDPVQTARGASRPIHGKIIGTPHKGTHTLGNWESDNAVDVAMPVGTPIYAPTAGTIGKQFGSLGKSGRFEGIRMHLLTPQDELYLAHLSKVAKGIGPGVHVNAGQLLGYSGEANGVGHLHLGARNDDAQSYVS